MKLFTFVEDLMMKLSGIPGLQFLGGYVTQIQNRRTHRLQKINQYRSYVQTVRGVKSQMTQATGGPKKQVAAKKDIDESDIEDDIEDDYVEYEDDDYESYRL